MTGKRPRSPSRRALNSIAVNGSVIHRGVSTHKLIFTRNAECGTLVFHVSTKTQMIAWIKSSSDQSAVGREASRMHTRMTFFISSVVGIACGFSALPISGQTIERDTTITGPRGRTIERQVEIQRKPGSVERQVQIKRPGGTFDRQVQIQRTPVGPARRGPLIAGPWPRPPWIPRTIVVGQPAPAFGFGLLAAPMLNFSFGGGGPAGPFGGGGAPGGPGPGPPQPPDQVALMTQRLQSFYPSNRKEAAYTLGQLGDPRAVPSLIHVLKYDL